MFKAMTMIDVKISSVPFTTIKPNVGGAHVITDCVCKEFGVKCKPNHGMCKNGKRFIPVKLMDVAGLVPDAHLGKGMGVQFLDDLRQAAAFIHVIDTTGDTDAEGKPTEGRDPEEDIKFLEKEIDYWFASIIERALKKFERELAKVGKADLVDMLHAQLTGLEVTKHNIEAAMAELGIGTLDVKDSEAILKFATALRKIAKPFVIAANKIDLSKAQENYGRMKGSHPNMVPCSAEAEIALKRAAEKEIIDYLPGNGFTTSEAADEQQRKALEFIKMRILANYGTTGV
ncbi:MAG: GTPase, partial [Candidatus Aenigmatarchaeota archaeon]